MPDEAALPASPIKGRGAVTNRPGRYERGDRPREDDGWNIGAELSEDRPETTVTLDATRRIIARNESPDIGFDRSINPYRGCEHGCVYCFARPTHAWLGLSPGLDFETKLFAKPAAAERLREELASPRYTPAVMALGTNTDPYQPIERKLGITRQILEVLAECRHPVSIVTKSALVLRDLDILSAMAKDGLANVSLSVTTLDPALARKMEPRAPAASRRLEAMRQLSEAGIPTGVMAAPIIPAINDMEIERILDAAAAAGATSAGYVLLRLPLEIKDLFDEWLAAHYPQRATRVMALIRDTRNGQAYDSRFGARMKGEGPYAEMIKRRFALACRRLDLNRRRSELRTDLFRPPVLRANPQLSLFADSA
ncbi:MAG: PA0069 family radical SAM protein [Dongiaceae bacterium]